MRPPLSDLLRRRWPELGLIGAANLLAQILTYVLVAGLVMPLLLGYLGAGRHRLAIDLDGGSRELLALVAGAAGRAGLLVVPVLLAAGAFMLAGMLGAVGSLLRGESVSLLSYWRAGATGFGRALGVMLLFAGGALSLMVLLVALLGRWGILLWGLLLMPGSLYGLVYPIYLSSVEGLGIGAAFALTGRALVRDPAEATLVSLFLVGFALCYSLLLGVLFRFGFLGHVAIGFLLLLVPPTLLLYLVARYTTLKQAT